MSITSTLGKLKREQDKIKLLLKELEIQKKEVDDRYLSATEKDNKVNEELQKCRDPYQYSRLEMRLHTLSSRRRAIEIKKEEIARKIRGHREELNKVKDRIEYMRPKGKLVSHKE